ncbi:MAG: hypothetical protein RJA22_989 [Verrucomicrobiota bacterium]|jgi:hypothetical protein
MRWQRMLLLGLVVGLLGLAWRRGQGDFFRRLPPEPASAGPESGG